MVDTWKYLLALCDTPIIHIFPHLSFVFSKKQNIYAENHAQVEMLFSIFWKASQLDRKGFCSLCLPNIAMATSLVPNSLFTLDVCRQLSSVISATYNFRCTKRSNLETLETRETPKLASRLKGTRVKLIISSHNWV